MKDLIYPKAQLKKRNGLWHLGIPVSYTVGIDGKISEVHLMTAEGPYLQCIAALDRWRKTTLKNFVPTVNYHPRGMIVMCMGYPVGGGI